MRSRHEVLTRLRELRAEKILAESYGGPAPSPAQAAQRDIEIRVLSWVLNEEAS